MEWRELPRWTGLLLKPLNCEINTKQRIFPLPSGVSPPWMTEHWQSWVAVSRRNARWLSEVAVIGCWLTCGYELTVWTVNLTWLKFFTITTPSTSFFMKLFSSRLFMIQTQQFPSMATCVYISALRRTGGSVTLPRAYIYYNSKPSDSYIRISASLYIFFYLNNWRRASGWKSIERKNTRCVPLHKD